MNEEDRSFPGFSIEKFQVQKIYVKNLNPKIDLAQTHKDIFEYFSLFGTVIDSKVLTNREIKRKKRCFCLCHI